MSKEIEIKFPVMGDDNLRKLTTPHEDKDIKYYVATLRAEVLHKYAKELNTNWSELNPRDVNRGSYVWKEMMESLEYYPEEFIFKNKGMLMMLDDLTYDNKNKSVNIKLKNNELHGVADGGHTMDALWEYIENNKDDKNAFVKVEFLTGFKDKEKVVEIVAARNTAKQVQDESVMDSKGEFDEIKRRLADEVNYVDRVAYSEYETDEDGVKKDISIKEIVGMLIAFDNTSFGEGNPPIIAYSGKKTALKHYAANRLKIDKLYTPLLPKFLELWDTIYKEIPSICEGDIMNVKKNESGKSLARDLSNKTKKIELKFIGEECDYKIPPAWVYPIFSAFRNLLEEKNGIASFPEGKDPIDFFLRHKKEFSIDFMNALEGSNNDPQTFAKSKNTWTSFSYKVELLSTREG